jgi:hypothetical protein
MEAETETHADAAHDAAVHDSAADAARHASEKREQLAEEAEQAEADRLRAVGESKVEPRRPTAREELRKERAEAEASGVAPYGEGEDGYKRPRTRQERMRKGTPYKVGFRAGALSIETLGQQLTHASILAAPSQLAVQVPSDVQGVLRVAPVVFALSVLPILAPRPPLSVDGSTGAGPPCCAPYSM